MFRKTDFLWGMKWWTKPVNTDGPKGIGPYLGPNHLDGLLFGP
jgi:hypothetical protein